MFACLQSLIEEGQSESDAADEAAIVSAQLAYAQARAGKRAAATERLKQVVRSRYVGIGAIVVGTDGIVVGTAVIFLGTDESVVGTGESVAGTDKSVVGTDESVVGAGESVVGTDESVAGSDIEPSSSVSHFLLHCRVLQRLLPPPSPPRRRRRRSFSFVLSFRPSDPAVALVSTANLAALGGYKDSQEALKRCDYLVVPHF